MRDDERDESAASGPDAARPLYMISVAAQLAGVHPQTLRIYERRELICPRRTPGGTRVYSDLDVARVRLIQELTQEFGLNLAGVERVMGLQDEIEALQGAMTTMRIMIIEMQREMLEAVEDAHRQHRREIVLYRPNPPAVRGR
jgi:MerR family transcriptional regulator/heat shock protein HspR